MSYRSELMNALRDELGIQAKFSSPLHFISHGRVERLNASVEKVMRTFVEDNYKDRDKMIPFLHFFS